MKFDIDGRIRNMRLPDGRTAVLFSIFEAVSNGIHAIEERFGADNVAEKGALQIIISQDKEKFLSKVVINDNGVGLNPSHLESFETCDTLEKKAIGGRGVGRLVWAKAFETIEISSTYAAGSNRENVSFSFDPFEDDSLINLVRRTAPHSPVGTEISLANTRADHQVKLAPGYLARAISHHFFAYFIAGCMPNVTITRGRKSIDIGQYLSTRIVVQHTESVDLSSKNIGTISLTHVYIDPNIARELSNSILLTAQGRVVESIEIEKKFALRNLEGKKAYACVVKATFLDERVDQERTSFKADPLLLDVIKEEALIAAENFLSAHIKKVRETQKKIVIDLLEEHPQLALSVSDISAYVERLSPSMSDEDIGKTLFTLLYRHEKKIRAQIASIERKEDEASGDWHARVDELTQRVSDDAKRRLAEYTIKRHQIIQIARSLLRYTDEEKKTYAWEKTVHELICPMGRMMTGKNYSDHNLWLLDDLLSYYQFFASDKSLASLGIDGGRQEPDILFLNPFGFRREGTNDPVVIVEFKRPGDESPTSDPVDQVLGYIDKLRSKTVRGPDGEVISEIGRETPFECVIVCDLTEGTRRKFERSVAQNPTPDGLGYYGYSSHHRASIRVLSYRKVFRDAELRNQSFFEHLGILPEEVRLALNAPDKPPANGAKDERQPEA